MKTESKTYQLVGYGLYYRSNNQLIKKANARVLFQLLIDLVRNGTRGNSTQEITQDRNTLCRWAGLEDDHAGPSSFKRLEGLGLIKINSTKSVVVNCDEYVTAILYYESLSGEEKKSFALAFQKEGVTALKRFNIQIQCGCGSQLAKMSGSSFLKQIPEQRTEKIQLQIQKLAIELKKFSCNCNSSVIKELTTAEFFQLPCYSVFKNAFETGKINSEAALDPDFELNFFSWVTEFFQFISQKTTEFFQHSNNM